MYNKQKHRLSIDFYRKNECGGTGGCEIFGHVGPVGPVELGCHVGSVGSVERCWSCWFC